MSEKLHNKIEKTLADRMSHQLQDWQHSDAYSNYCKTPELSLLDGVRFGDFEQDFRSGAGGELEPDGNKPPKFCALISSSALAANCFGPFRRDPSSLEICGLSGFDDLRFEAECPTGLKGTPPTLDVLLTSQDRVLAIETKFTEYLTPKPAKFSDAYDRLLGTLFESQWAAVYDDLISDPIAYAPLDAAQLIKHYLGLRNTFPNRNSALLYLYWEPTNAREHGIFRDHRDAVDRFANRLKESGVTFRHMSFPSLWQGWAASGSHFLQSHASSLKARYLLGE